ncbi:adenine deaminase [Jannaschia sp. Os4]|uniref:adenine deaminase n=1 Tax=Jannaschia sp. Os4 TaxID=2807617 RepID=UPI00193988CD|nr:adenine deaminase C-terminal domain-containing protein [Jannaschia sp. Os4]MBM2575488.1 adenine deaminase [Jannaschia sp. Os4]
MTPFTHRTLPTWPEAAADLIAVAAGRARADLVIRDVRLANVHTRETLDWEIAIRRGRFAYVGPDASHCVGEATEVIEGEGMVAAPGLIDAHMHVESGMLTPARFAEAVVPRGTTAMMADPHEIANVLGLPGVRMMLDEAMGLPCSMFMQMPSCAPSAPGLETTGVELGPDEVAEAMGWDGIVGLGEMMNFPGVVHGSQQMLAEMAATAAAGRTIGGHYASPDLGPAFHAYAAGGPADDHEGTSEADAVARMRQGMRAMLRLGSAWHDVAAQITAVTKRGLDPRGVILCTDDCYAATLVRDGHMDRVLRHAIACGCDPLVALQMCTVNAATHFGLERELGSIAPGRRADVVLTETLEGFEAKVVVALGAVVARDGDLAAGMDHADWAAAKGTVRLGRALTAGDFALAAPAGAETVEARVIGVVENQAPTRALTRTLPVRDGVVDGEGPTCMIALVERHRATGGVVNAFVEGFGYAGDMALASTVAHDSHHMIVVGTSRADMAAAANRLADVGGGACLFSDGVERAMVELPVAGLMSDDPAPAVAAKAEGLAAAMRDAGCTMNEAFMQHSLLALVVIPELRIGDLGLVDVTKFELTEVLA